VAYNKLYFRISGVLGQRQALSLIQHTALILGLHLPELLQYLLWLLGAVVVEILFVCAHVLDIFLPLEAEEGDLLIEII
jgi:hypothetical protein